MRNLGQLLVGLGLVLIVAGSFFWLGGRIPWFGNLPGDFYYETDNVTVYAPIATCLVLSLLLSLLFYAFRLFS